MKHEWAFISAALAAVGLLWLYSRKPLTEDFKMPKECTEPECEALAKGVDLEAAFDDEGWPIWLVAYECMDGHNFVLEWDRDEEVLAKK